MQLILCNKYTYIFHLLVVSDKYTHNPNLSYPSLNRPSDCPAWMIVVVITVVMSRQFCLTSTLHCGHKLAPLRIPSLGKGRHVGLQKSADVGKDTVNEFSAASHSGTARAIHVSPVGHTASLLRRHNHSRPSLLQPDMSTSHINLAYQPLYCVQTSIPTS